jgi:hypothetical protein
MTEKSTEELRQELHQAREQYYALNKQSVPLERHLYEVQPAIVVEADKQEEEC